MKRIYIVPLILAFLLSLHYWSGMVLTTGFSFWGKAIYFLLDAIGVILSLTAVFMDLPKMNPRLKILDWIGYCWFGVFSWLVVSAFGTTIVRILFPDLHFSRYYPLGGVALLTAWSLWGGLRFPTLTRHRKSFSLPEGKLITPLRIVQLSDVHIGMLHLRRAWLEKIVRAVNAQNPDIVVITGDLVESPMDVIAGDLDPLKAVKAKLGRFYVTGNHEYYYGGEVWEKRLRDLGWTSLHSESAVVQHEKLTVQISGVPDRQGVSLFPNVNLSYTQALREEAGTFPPVDFKVLLVHQPSEIYKVASEAPDLVLTGHTHGGQVFPFWPFVRLVQPLVSGWKKINGMLLFVHQGTGFWGPPMRLGSRSEIAVIDVIG